MLIHSISQPSRSENEFAWIKQKFGSGKITSRRFESALVDRVYSARTSQSTFYSFHFLELLKLRTISISVHALINDASAVDCSNSLISSVHFLSSTSKSILHYGYEMMYVYFWQSINVIYINELWVHMFHTKTQFNRAPLIEWLVRAISRWYCVHKVRRF